MEYKPPFENKTNHFNKKYRFLYCSQDSDEKWICKRCNDTETCELPLLNQQSQKTELIKINDHLPYFLDQIILYQKLSQFPNVQQ